MNETDAMRLLADANPVQPQDLTPLDAPFAPRPPNRRRLGAAIAMAAVAAAVLVGVFTLNGSNSVRRAGDVPRLHGPAGATGANGATGTIGGNGATGSQGPSNTGGPPPPVDPTTAFYADGPTGATGPTRTPLGPAETTTLVDARAAFRATLVLPDVAPVDPSSIDKVIKDCGEPPRGTGCDIGIGFPEQRIWIYYQVADQWAGSSDPLAVYRRVVGNDPRARIVHLNGTPALITPAGPGKAIEFLLNGARIRIWVVNPVPPGNPTLQAIAQSIVDRSK